MVLQARKQVEALGLSGHGLRCHAPRQAGQGHAVAAEALQVKQVVAQASKVGRAVHADVDEATPDVFDRHLAQLGKNVAHALRHDLLQPRRRARRVAHAPAKQHAMVGAETEVVEHEIVVTGRGIAGNEAPAQGRVERCGADDVGAHRHDAWRQLRRHQRPVFAQGAVAGEHAKARRHGALIGTRRQARIAAQQRRHRGTLVDLHAQALRRARQAEPVLQWVQVAGAGFVAAGPVQRALDMRLHRRAAGKLHRNAVVALQGLHLGFELARLAFGVGHVEVAVHAVAVDAKFGDALVE